MTFPTNCTLAVTESQLLDFPGRFAEQVGRTPDAEALRFEGSSISYRALNDWANRIANYLFRQGIESEQRIGICLDRSPQAIAAMIGIMRSGAAFVPLDPEFPLDRLQFIVDDAGIDTILCDRQHRQMFAGTATLEIVDDLLDEKCQVEELATELAADQLAYVMYTSGSTGQPKGVQIEHRSLMTYCLADVDVYRLQSSDRTLQFSTLNFDIAIEEIFPPLLTGGAVVIRPRDRSQGHNELSTICATYDVTAIHLATAYWHEWVDLMVATQARVPRCLRLMVVTGEKVSAEHYRRWQGLCDHEVLWCNAYGPTEATVSATVFIPPDDWEGDNLPIGKPLCGYKAHIFNESLQPVDRGSIGKLYLSGPALARGYLNRPDLTDRAFIEKNIDRLPERLYDSGDLAKWLPTGDIQFCGRVDHQIKLGSYRIEPGEIEASIHQHPSVLESLVTYEEIEGTKYLIGYVALGEHPLTPTELANHLSQRLPTYMVPSRYVLVPTFPKTINGKIDRDRLPPAATAEVAGRTTTRPPQTDLQLQLVAIWQDVLNVPTLGVDDDFFALGGSSLLVTRVITQICNSMQIELPVRDFFANPTIALIAAHIEQLIDSEVGNKAAVNSHAEQARVRLRASLPTVEPCFFRGGSSQLFGVHYLPNSTGVAAPGQAECSRRAVLICPSYGHEYVRGHRNLQQLAVLLAKQGIHVLRFDYSGTGNSHGSCEEGEPSRWIDDIAAAADELRIQSGCNHLSVVGLRLGATLASASEIDALKSLVFWDPVFSGSAFVELLDQCHQHFLREQFVGWRRWFARRQRKDQAFGYPMPTEKRRQLNELSLAWDVSSNLRVPVTIIGSREYFNDEPSSVLPANYAIVRTDDEIYWRSQTYTNRAFSSLGCFEAVCRALANADECVGVSQ